MSAAWKWVVNPKHHGVELSEGSHGNLVMAFRRWGMGSATPLFAVNGVMVPAHQLTVLEPGREHHADWWRLVDHPTARLIEAAPVLLAAAHRALVNHENAGCSCDGCAQLRAAILRAQGSVR